MKTFNQYIREKIDPYKTHNLRMQKGYRPKYRQGLIAVHFKDEESKNDNKSKFFINYQNLMSDRTSDFRNYFEKKYNVKLSDYRPDNDYFFYFTCVPGKEKEIMENMASDESIDNIDFVDVRELNVDELRDIAREIEKIADDYTEIENDISQKEIYNIIDKLKKLL